MARHTVSGWASMSADPMLAMAGATTWSRRVGSASTGWLRRAVGRVLVIAAWVVRRWAAMRAPARQMGPVVVWARGVCGAWDGPKVGGDAR
jgi:hypothetical protein